MKAAIKVTNGRDKRYHELQIVNNSFILKLFRDNSKAEIVFMTDGEYEEYFLHPGIFN